MRERGGGTLFYFWNFRFDYQLGWLVFFKLLVMLMMVMWWWLKKSVRQSNFLLFPLFCKREENESRSKYSLAGYSFWCFFPHPFSIDLILFFKYQQRDRKRRKQPNDDIRNEEGEKLLKKKNWEKN